MRELGFTELAEAYLKELTEPGDHVIDVARNLQRQGIVGQRFRSSSCPVAMFLRSKVGPVTVARHWVRSLENNAKAKLPDSVSVFAKAFDQGFFSELRER